MISALLFLVFLIVLISCHFRRNSTGCKYNLPPGIPIFGYLPFLGKVPCETVANLSKTWGPLLTIRLGNVPVIFVNDFGIMKDLYKSDLLSGRAQLPLFDKRGIYGLGLLEGEDWKEVRRFCLRSLRDFGFGKKSMESSILEEVSNVISMMRKEINHPLYLKPLIELSVLNALWFLLTSEKYNMEDPAKREVAEIMSEGLSDQNIVGIAAFLPWLAKLFPTYFGYYKAMKYFEAPEALAKDIIEKHAKSYRKDEEKDFIDHALTKIYETTDPHSMFYSSVGMRNLHYTLIDLFFAGSDTMSSTLGWAFLYLAMWPEKQIKIQQEIDAEIGRMRLPCLEDRQRMPFTEATMWEVMRLSTMVPFGLFHKNLEDLDFEGYLIPKGTLFLSNLHHIFKEKEYWEDPETFRPERFINNGKFQKDERLIPFFVGKRTCIGESLALIEYFLFLTGILQQFKFSLNENEPLPDIGPRSGFILRPPRHKLIVEERGSLL